MKQAILALEEAVTLLLEQTPAPEVFDAVPLLDASGRVVCQDYFARIDQPPFDRSPLDGYAARHEDLGTAGREHPAVLTVTRQIHAGDAPGKPLGPGESVRVATGAPIPPEATCVAAQEDTDCGKERVEVYVSLKKHQNCVFRGEDFHAGQRLAERGTRLTGAHIGLLAGQGIGEVRVSPRPKVGLLSVGSELVPAGKGGTLLPGRIYDSNSPTLAARVRELGGEAHVEERVPDEPAQISAALERLLEGRDLVITSGGVSVGEHDYMPRVGELLGGKTLFHGLGYRPGGVTLALLKDSRLILCLSGNPFAAFMSLELLAGPVLRKLAGLKEVRLDRLRAVLRGDFSKPSPNRRFIRGRLRGGEVFVEKEGHASGSLLSLTRCNCLIDIPPGSPSLSEGTEVEVIPLQG
ncbi:MAG: molybdopterin molybdotransferase MoeA [Synergistaceae bacterium]|nr:molybdopterin molybdotransferase MoeA [Synergistaceae bacterium]